jgi:hypothetical protein
MQAYSVGFSSNPEESLGGDELCFKSTECPTADCKFLTLYPTNFTVPDEMLAVLQSLAGRKPTPPRQFAQRGEPPHTTGSTLRYSRYRTNPKVICIHQDVPTYFYAVQRSRLPTIVMPLDIGLSDTNRGEVNQTYCIKSTKYLLVSSMPFSLFPCGKITQRAVVNSRAIHLNTSLSGRCEAFCCLS